MKINIHTHRKTSDSAVEIINWSEENSLNAHFSAGIHPWQAGLDYSVEDFLFYEKLIQDARCLAIGECGLDKKKKVDGYLQQVIFKRHIEWALEYNKPLIIHCVGAFQELLAVRKKYPKELQMIVHGFEKNIQVAESLIKHDIYVSFGARLLVNEQNKQVLAQLPLDYIFLETDDSLCSIEQIYKQASEILEIPEEDLEQKIKQNFTKLFEI